jgi:hypothetical protein
MKKPTRLKHAIELAVYKPLLLIVPTTSRNEILGHSVEVDAALRNYWPGEIADDRSE